MVVVESLHSKSCNNHFIQVKLSDVSSVRLERRVFRFANYFVLLYVASFFLNHLSERLKIISEVGWREEGLFTKLLINWGVTKKRQKCTREYLSREQGWLERAEPHMISDKYRTQIHCAPPTKIYGCGARCASGCACVRVYECS